MPISLLAYCVRTQAENENWSALCQLRLSLEEIGIKKKKKIVITFMLQIRPIWTIFTYVAFLLFVPDVFSHASHWTVMHHLTGPVLPAFSLHKPLLFWASPLQNPCRLTPFICHSIYSTKSNKIVWLFMLYQASAVLYSLPSINNMY